MRRHRDLTAIVRFDKSVLSMVSNTPNREGNIFSLSKMRKRNAIAAKSQRSRVPGVRQDPSSRIVAISFSRVVELERGAPSLNDDPSASKPIDRELPPRSSSLIGES